MTRYASLLTLAAGLAIAGCASTDYVAYEEKPRHLVPETIYSNQHVSNADNAYFSGAHTHIPVNDKQLSGRTLTPEMAHPATVSVDTTYDTDPMMYQNATADESGRIGAITPAQQDRTVVQETTVTPVTPATPAQPVTPVITGQERTPQLGAGNDKNTIGENLSATDRRFINEAAAGGMYEVNAGNVALLKAQSASVKTLAQHIINDHNKLNSELKNLASRKGMNETASQTPEQSAMIDRLNQLTGADFDREYLAQQRKAHEETIAKFQTASSSADDKSLRDWAASSLPMLRNHLQMVSNETPTNVTKD